MKNGACTETTKGGDAPSGLAAKIEACQSGAMCADMLMENLPTILAALRSETATSIPLAISKGMTAGARLDGLEEAAQVCETKAAQSSVEMFGVAMRLAATAIRALKNDIPKPAEAAFCPVSENGCQETPVCPWPCKRLKPSSSRCVAVPLEPTLDMIRAAQRGNLLNANMVVQVYAAMLAAAGEAERPLP